MSQRLETLIRGRVITDPNHSLNLSLQDIGLFREYRMVSESISILTTWVQSIALLMNQRIDLPPVLEGLKGIMTSFLSLELSGIPLTDHYLTFQRLTSLDVRFQFIILTSIIPLLLTVAVLIFFHELYLIACYLLMIFLICLFVICIVAAIFVSSADTVYILNGNVNAYLLLSILVGLLICCCCYFSCFFSFWCWVKRKILKSCRKVKINREIKREGKERYWIEQEMEERKNEIERSRLLYQDFDVEEVDQLADDKGSDGDEEEGETDDGSLELEDFSIKTIGSTKASTPQPAKDDDRIFVPNILGSLQQGKTKIVLDEDEDGDGDDDEKKDPDEEDDEKVVYLKQKLKGLERTESFKIRKHELYDLKKRRKRELKCHCFKFCRLSIYGVIIFVPSIFLARIVQFDYFRCGNFCTVLDTVLTSSYIFLIPGIVGTVLGLALFTYNCLLCCPPYRKCDYQIKRSFRRHAVKYIFFVVQLFYTPMITAVFTMFVCQTIPCPEGTYLPHKFSLMNVENLVSSTYSGSSYNNLQCIPCTFHENCNCTYAQNITICPEYDYYRLIEDPILRCYEDIARYYWFPSILFGIVWICFIPCFYCQMTGSMTKKMKAMDVKWLMKKNIPLWIRSRRKAKRKIRMREGRDGPIDLIRSLFSRSCDVLGKCLDICVCLICWCSCIYGGRTRWSSRRVAKLQSDEFVYTPYSKEEREFFMRRERVVNEMLCFGANDASSELAHLLNSSSSSSSSSGGGGDEDQQQNSDNMKKNEKSKKKQKEEEEEEEDISGIIQSVSDVEEGGRSILNFTCSSDEESSNYYITEKKDEDEPVDISDSTNLDEENSEEDINTKKKKKKKKNEKIQNPNRFEAPILELKNGLPYVFEKKNNNMSKKKVRKRLRKLDRTIEMDEKWKIRNILTKNSTKFLYSTCNYKHRFFRLVTTFMKILLVGSSTSLILFPRVALTMALAIHVLSVILYCLTMPYIDTKLDFLIILSAMSSAFNATYLLLPAYGTDPTNYTAVLLITVNMIIPLLTCCQCCWDFCYYRRQERKYKRWMKRLRKSQKEGKINEVEKVDYKEKIRHLKDADEILVQNASKKIQCLFLFLGIISIVCGSSSLLGLFYGILDPEYVDTSSSYSGLTLTCDEVKYIDFVGYEDWEEFVENCCCSLATHHEDNLLTSGYVTVEFWRCANGEMKERVRMMETPYASDDEDIDMVYLNGTIFRSVCSKEFLGEYYPTNPNDECTELNKIEQDSTEIDDLELTEEEILYLRKFLW